VIFNGEHQHALDEKGRLTLPARFREGLGAKCVLAKGARKPMPRLRVYPMETWEKMSETLESLNDFDPRIQDFKLRFFAGSAPCEIDRQGRLLLNQEFRTYGKLTKDIYIVGAGNYLEIYDKQAWESKWEVIDDIFDTLASEIFNPRAPQ